MNHIEVIARVLIVKENRILTCKTVKEGHYFLPGGHVEFGESAETTLIREMQEEAHAIVSNLKHIGMFENSYGEVEELHHEINIIYSGEVSDEQIVSAEPHIVFEWIPVENFSNIKFLPKIFVPAILEYISSTKSIYLSTLK